MRQNERPDIILIEADQLSAGSLGLYGNPVVRTPALEKLAGEGVLFRRAYCNYPACSPSRCSMMTGRYASTIRNHANHMLLDPEEVSLPVALKRAGYRTALIGKNHCFMDGRGVNDYPDGPASAEDAGEEKPDELRRVFDYVFAGDHISVQGQEADAELDAAIRWGREHCWGQQHHYGTNPHAAEKSVTHVLCREACEYVRGSGEEPYFLWLSIPDPHTPYQVSEPYASLYDPAAVPAPIADSLEGKPERQRVAHLMDFNHERDAGHWRRLRAIHYGMINQVDDGLARLFEALEASGRRENTIVVFTSDHGDSMGDHGIIQKQNFFYDSFCRIPLIVRAPGRAVVGETREGPVSLVDLTPTLLELAGVDAPHGVQGTSLVPALAGQAEAAPGYVVIESGEAGQPPTLADIHDEAGRLVDKGTSFAWCAFREAWLGRGRCLCDGRWKLAMYATGEGELYDLERDPDEVENLYGRASHAEVERGLKERLLEWFLKSADTIPANRTVGLTIR
jgi:arylsulfatase A-like enzyme